MLKVYLLLLFFLCCCLGCQWHLKPPGEKDGRREVVVERFDRMERLFLTTGDFAALQQMKTAFPIETRTLIEDVLKLGLVDEVGINTRFLFFFQDSTLQTLMSDVEKQYADMTDVNRELTEAFGRLVELMPGLEVPRIYTQIGALDQSVVVGDSMVGISLDKYLGENHPVYLKYGYSEEQRSMMTRQFIVPDCLGFYLLGRYPMSEAVRDSVSMRHAYMDRIQYVVNRVTGRKVFTHDGIRKVEDVMNRHPEMTLEQLLTSVQSS